MAKTSMSARKRELIGEMIREFDITNAKDIHAALKELFSGTLEDMLNAELDEHLGYEKHEQGEKPTTNRRNGSKEKKVLSHMGELTLQSPRDREGSFEPVVVPKGQKDVSELEEKVMAMYAKAMSQRDIEEIIKDIYGIEMSAETISRITDKVIPRMNAWRNRDLRRCYPFVFVDSLFVDIKEGGRSKNRAVYCIVGIDEDGYKDVLGFWIGEENESAHFWMGIFDEVKSRGVEDIFMVSCDGLAGLEKSIRTIYPQTNVMRCMVHLVRNSVKYIPTKEWKAFCAMARDIYSAPSLAAAQMALSEMEKVYGEKYPKAVEVWTNNFSKIELLFEYPSEIRRIIYTTNAIESLNSGLRKVTRGKGSLPGEQSLCKLLFLRIEDITRKWTRPCQNWSLVRGQLAIHYPDRMPE